MQINKNNGFVVDMNTVFYKVIYLQLI